jgi:hypothetical protein
MRIHSSSLTFSPINLNQKIGRDHDAQNKDERDLFSDTKDAQSKKPSSSPEEIKKTLEDAGLAIDFSSQENIVKPLNARSLRALSAYVQEFNAPLQSQRAELIAGIDTYA